MDWGCYLLNTCFLFVDVRNRIAKGFDLLAPVYDALARWTIGKDIVQSQLCFLDRLKTCNRILVLGGGSGWILESLCAQFPNLEIDYIDLSPKMIARSIPRLKVKGRVNFIIGTEEDIPDSEYDGIITNFYLDLFASQTLSDVIEKLKSARVDHSIWIATDFVNERKWHAIKLWCMYRFFGVISHIEAKRLSDWQSLMIKAGFILMEQKKFANGFIAANCYVTKKAESLNS